jgi:methionyl-tRNA formyltransferase
MFDTVVLLTGAAEQPILAAAMRGHNAQLAVVPVASAAELATLTPSLLQRSRLIAFATPVIVPISILARLGYGAYNFHPGPPDYPGLAPAQFAIYDRAAEFGATAHLMVEKVDAGPIIDAARFPIPPGITVFGLEGLAYAHLARLFWELSRRLATQATPLPQIPVRWGERRSSRRLYRAICDIPLDIAKEELDRRVRAFGHNHFGLLPTITLHGIEFRAVAPPPPAAATIAANPTVSANQPARQPACAVI